MAEEYPSQMIEAGSENTESVAKERPPAGGEGVPTLPGTAERWPESSTKGMLREAIQKVMAEIEFHEQEANKHLQQAEALRKDLRESFAFLQEREGKGKSIEV